MNEAIEAIEAIEAARETIEEAGFRTATHDHETVVREARTGEKPGARSRVLSLSASSVGLCRAYQKKGHFVAASRHEWVLNPSIKLTLSECRHGTCVLIGSTIRVRQGRGTGLVCERLVDGRWARD